MKTLYHCGLLITMDGGKREIPGGCFVVEDGWVHSVYDSLKSVPDDHYNNRDNRVDFRSHIVMPGLINTHHHMYQTLTRTVPQAQDQLLFGWLQALYPIWAKITAEDVYVSAKLAMTELLLSGCTTSSDHLYLYPNDVELADTIRAAQELGFRFHPTRGSMSIGESAGGLPPDTLVENEEKILIDSERLIKKFHQPERGGMVRVGLAPCSPFSVSRELMIASADLARKNGVRLHTHLAENDEDLVYSEKVFGLTPIQYAEQCGWLGPDVWLAHCVKLDTESIKKLSKTQTSVSHCPCSNMRLGSGIAPIKSMLKHRVQVGLGVDGSASNDAGQLLNEARQALLLQRVVKGADAFSAREALELATLGGALALGREDLGSIEPGKCADFIAFDMDKVDYAGAWDLTAALIMCSTVKPSHVSVHGRMVVEKGRLKSGDQEEIVRHHRFCTNRLIESHNNQ